MQYQNEMVKHISENGIIVLHKIIQKCSNDGNLPWVWKQSVVGPTYKQPYNKCGSHQPVALSSHVGKLMKI